MNTPLDVQASEQALATQWLDITVERFQANMRRLKIKDTGKLLASFKQQVIGAAEGRLQLQLSYALYGKFVDMDVGRGMGAGVRQKDDGYDRIRQSRGRLRRHERKARKWYAKELAYQTKRLAELMSELHGTILISTVADVVPQTVVIPF